METIGSVQVVATINTKGYDDGKKHIESGNKSLDKNASETSKSFSSAWTGAIAGVTASITNNLLNTVSNLTGSMTDMYDATVKFPKVLETMGASSDFSGQAFADMKKYADDTIYSLEDMTKTFGSLYGITGKDTPKLVTALGGVSSLAGNAQQAMDSWSLQLTQMVSKPMVAWQDFRILLEQNPAAISKIAQSMGKTSSEIVADVNAGTLSTEDFLTALNNVGNDPSLQKMATSSDNFKNSTGQLEAAVVSAGATLLDKFGPTMIDIINTASSAVTGITDEVVKLIDWFAKGGTAVDIIKTLAVSVVTAMVAFKAYQLVIKVTTAITATFAAVSSYLTLVNSLQAQGLGVLRAAWLALNIVMKANIIGIIITLIGALVGALIWFFTQTELGKKIWEGYMNYLKFVVGIIVDVFKAAVGFIIDVWNALPLVFQLYWDTLMGIYKGVGKFFADIFQGAWNGIVKVFSVVGNFFMGVWNSITSIFTNIGTAIGNAIGGAFKNVINTILKFAIGYINGFIDAINGAIDLINNIPGVDIGKVGKLPVPQLAAGGITTGPTLAMIGEGKEQEAVLPLSKLDAMLNGGTGKKGGDTYNVTVNASADMIRSENDKREFAEMIVDSFNQTRKVKGLPAIG